MLSVAVQRASGVSPDKAKPSFFWFLAALVLPLWSLMARYRLHGEPLPRVGAVVLAPNHYSEIDPLVMGVATWKLGRAPRFLAKASLFRNPLLGWLLRSSGQIPVERHGASSHRALGAARALTEKGRLVIVYPEGTLTRDPDLWPMRGKTGAVRLALDYGIPLIPVAHWGTERLLPRYSKKIRLFRRTPIDILVGKPLNLDHWRGNTDPARYAEATDALMNEIARLVGELRQQTPPDERWDPAAHRQAETGRFDEVDNG